MHKTPSKHCEKKHPSLKKTMFSLLTDIFCGRGLKGRAECRQTERQTDKQTNKLYTARGQGAPIPEGL